MRTMTKYTPEQRRDAVQMLKDFGAQKAQEALGIPPTTLYRWKKRLEEKKEDLVSSDTWRQPRRAVGNQAADQG